MRISFKNSFFPIEELFTQIHLYSSQLKWRGQRIIYNTLKARVCYSTQMAWGQNYRHGHWFLTAIALVVGSFIFACGTIHIMENWRLWHSAQEFSGWSEVITVFICGYAVATLVQLVQKVRVLPHLTTNEKEALDLNPELASHPQIEEHWQLLERAISASSSGIIISDARSPDNPIIYVNSGFERITGYTVADILGKNCRFLQGTDTQQPDLEKLRKALREGRGCQVILRNYRKDGRMFWNEFSITPVRDATGNLTHFIGIQNDVSDRKQAEEALVQSEAKNRALISALPDLMMRVARDGTYLDFIPSKNYRTLNSNGIGKNLWDITPTEFAKERMYYIEKALSTGEIQVYELQREIEGETQYEEARIVASGRDEVLVLVRDITERKKIEEALRKSEAKFREKAQELERAIDELKHTQVQLVQSEKMSSLGQLIAGIAHEINNPVGFIHANINPAMEYASDLLNLIEYYQQNHPQPIAEIAQKLDSVDPDFITEDFPKLLNSMKEGADRICQIVQSLKNFSRLDRVECKQVDIHECIDSTLMILRHRLKSSSTGSEIKVIKEYGQLPLIDCYPGQLNQVFMNILSNAIDAVTSHEKADINTYEALIGRLSPTQLPSIWIRTAVIKNNKITICIADNGSGIPDDVKPKIFDPFFTTKPPGKGTGLGLSISYRIVAERHGGEMKCYSGANGGTEFVIELPLR
jgi:PAS domain S-box-containing protein